MKQVKIETFNGNTQLEQSFEIHSNTGINKVVGTALNRLFSYNDLLKEVGSKGAIKANDNCSVQISIDGSLEIDTYKLNDKIGAKLSFSKSAKSKKRFAKNINLLINWSLQELKVLTIDELIDSLED